MNEAISDLVQGILAAAAGIVLLIKLDAIARFDQRQGARFNKWLKRCLGNSFLTRDIHPVGTPGGLHKSRIGIGIAGATLVLMGLALAVVSLKSLIFLRQLSHSK
jgi:hypothetical protein